MEADPIRWFEADRDRWQRELAVMEAVAPELTWGEDLEGTTGGGWTGLCPTWPFARPRPPELDAFLAGRRFRIEVRCSPAHPVVAPAVMPIDPEPDLRVRTAQAWHVMGDGSLCLLQETLDWSGSEPAAELVVKAAGWYLEYLLLEEGVIDRMTLGGIAEDAGLDHLLSLRPTAPPGKPTDA